MKVMFVDAKVKTDLSCIEKNIDKIPDDCGLVTTLQHKHILKDAKEILENNNKKSVVLGQVLGCNFESALKKEAENVSCYLYIGTGRFHPIGIAIRTGKNVFCINPETKVFSKLENDTIEKFRRKKNASISLFLVKEKIGIIVSMKPGQMYNDGFELYKKLKEKYPDKSFYLFACSTLDFSELENFPFVELWINTMCPRIAYDDSIRMQKPVINIEDIQNNIN